MNAVVGARTTPVYLVRHAKAKRRSAWTGPDLLRPLTRTGRRQAEGLVRVIGGPVARVVSSPYLRCIETLGPLAAAHRLELETADELAEGASAHAALELALSLARTGTPVLCTHGDVLTLAVEELLGAAVPLTGPVEFEKGCTWILDAGERSFVSGRYVPPPSDRARSASVRGRPKATGEG